MSRGMGIPGGHVGSGGQIQSSEVNAAAANAALESEELSTLPRFTYNGKNIDFDIDVAILPWEPESVGTMNGAVSGQTETHLERTNVRVSVLLQRLSNDGAADSAIRRQLRQFSQWAQAGFAFSVARNRSKVINTTLASAVSAGASSVTVVSAAGIEEGDRYVLRDEFFVMSDITVAGVSGSDITFDESIDYDFAAGSRLRYAEFWPAVLAPGQNIIRDRDQMYFDVEFDFLEDVTGL